MVEERDMNAAERRQFVQKNKVCVYGYRRREHGPSMSICYYVMDGDDLLILTMRGRAKGKVALRDAKASICVLDMELPPSYLLVYGDVKVETDFELTVDTCMRAMGFELEYMSEEQSARTAAEREKVAELMRLEDRIVLRVTPYETFYSPATRGKSIDELVQFRRDLAGSQIQVGQSLPWR